ncbi:MAG TPA: hypothetical protein PK636_08310, partial [bacterium]|nr:hypothetical protein [bacterium]
VLGQVGDGAVLRFSGSAWVRETDLFPGGSGTNFNVYALDATHIWVSSHVNSPSQGRIYFGDGTNWYLQTQIAGTNWWIYDVYAVDENNVWASGPSGSIYHSQDGGAQWVIQTDTGLDYWFSIDGFDAENIWAVGNSTPARIIRYNGTDWTVETSFYTQTDGQYLRSVSAASPQDVWAAAEDGTVLRRLAGGQWTVSTTLGEQATNEAEISVCSSDNIWLGMDGDASGIYHFDGSSWKKQTDILYVTALDSRHGPRAWAGDVFGALYFLEISGSDDYRTDYDGDGTSDIAVFRDTGGLWAIRGVSRLYFGSFGDDPVPADYDGDGTTDVAVFRSGSGLWAIRGISKPYFGGSSDVPIPADYDGDGTYGPSIARLSTGLWAARGLTRLYFGEAGDTPLPGYYSGAPGMEVGVFRTSTGLWAVRGLTRLYFGGSTDTGIPGDYTGDGIWKPGVFRTSTGLWAVRGVTRLYFGTTG